MQKWLSLSSMKLFRFLGSLFRSGGFVPRSIDLSSILTGPHWGTSVLLEGEAFFAMIEEIGSGVMQGLWGPPQVWLLSYGLWEMALICVCLWISKLWKLSLMPNLLWIFLGRIVAMWMETTPLSQIVRRAFSILPGSELNIVTMRPINGLMRLPDGELCWPMILLFIWNHPLMLTFCLD